MDVPNQLVRRLVLGVILAAALALRLKGIHNPILDHPGWRQGDTAAIARNFAQLDYNPLHPQVDYNGPPPNYVELELQIVPFAAATLYKVFGVHEIFGRLISVAFSLGTVGVLYFFGRWLFASEVAGFGAALAFALYPGSVYYGRTFTPDTTMIFFLTAALFTAVRWIVEDGSWGKRLWWSMGLGAFALLAKPVAAAGLIALPFVMIERSGWAGAPRKPQYWALLAAITVPYAAYDAYVASIAQWHWASGITRKHVVPLLKEHLSSPGGLRSGLQTLWDRLGMLPATMLGGVGVLLAAAGVVAGKRARSRALLYAWLGGALLYTFTVVAYEKVDYYLYVFLPLAALWTGGLAARAADRLPATGAARAAGLGAAAIAAGALLVTGRSAVARYYDYKGQNYVNAQALDATLDKNALVVMGHYDPSILYYINRKGWQEDPGIWTPFDEESAIRKGSRYFIAVEKNRFEANQDLAAWMERFPLRNERALWPVYETDPGKMLSGSEQRWQRYRAHERALGKKGTADLPHGALPPEAQPQP